jgi:hypothetical protein
MSRMAACVVAVVLALPTAALAGEVVFQFRTEEDPGAAPAGEKDACLSAPFRVNLRLPASVYVPIHRFRDGKVLLDGHRKAGRAVACALLTDLTFPEGLTQDFYVRFELPEGRFTAVGKCMAVSNQVPRAGVVLTGCALKLTEFPRGYVGGFATSSSVFNPFGLPGYSTGSYWTLRLFEQERVSPSGPGRSAMEWVEDARADEEIANLSHAP